MDWYSDCTSFEQPTKQTRVCSRLDWSAPGRLAAGRNTWSNQQNAFNKDLSHIVCGKQWPTSCLVATHVYLWPSAHSLTIATFCSFGGFIFLIDIICIKGCAASTCLRHSLSMAFLRYWKILEQSILRTMCQLDTSLWASQ